QAVLTHEEAEHVAADAAPEAMEDALARVDHERGRLLAVERTEPLVVLAGLAESDEAPDELDDIHARPDLVQQGGWVGRHQDTFSAATVAPLPPSAGSPSRYESTRGCSESTPRTALRRAPVPLPWTSRTWAIPAMNASSRYFSTRSRASSVVRPISISSGAIDRVKARSGSAWDPEFPEAAD